ncbi:MAG: efflux RND transporter permease subunit, partial [Alphaproteobacteria bacterium]|nr:efflux RND transporter permease subunit [Alphaproteobacteria bacterium]
MIALFARHPTAANLLMAAMLVIGLLALSRMNKQFFPDFGIDVVLVTVTWPGAGAEDVDNAIVQAIEPEVRFLDRVKRVVSNSQEGRASISVEYEAGSDMQAALADVDAAISRVATLPEDSEAPWIRRVVRYENLLRIVLSGNLPERTLKTWATQMRDGLIRAGVDEVEMVGARDEWILVEADQQSLLALDLPISEISSRIAGASRDIPGGDTGGHSVSRVRSLGLARTAEEVAAVEVRAFPDGRRLTLGEVAEVSEAWDENQPRVYFDGRPAVELIVKRATTADALETAEAAAQFLDGFLPTLPPGVTVKQYDAAAELIDQRIDLL